MRLTRPGAAGGRVEPECWDEYEETLREAERTGPTMAAYGCVLDPPRDCEPAYIEVQEGGRPPEWVLRTCAD